jgi:hypothetical protein
VTLRRLAPLLLAALLAGCGGGVEAGGDGSATLWVTRDRGGEVLFTGVVPAGLTVLEAVDRQLDVDTRYGGRFVDAIEGIEGSLEDRRDWFYFVNGYESDVGAAEYRLHDGDVAWWDFRSWADELRRPVVVGAFPEPFLHGFGGERRPAVVRYRLPSHREAARALGRLVGAQSVAPAAVPVADEANVLRLEPGAPSFTARLRDTSASAGAAVEFVLAGDPMRLVRRPDAARFRYEGTR